MPFGIEILNTVFNNYGDNTHFGHDFTVRLTFDGHDVDTCNLRWYERTDKPYVIQERWNDGEWIDLIAELGEGSNVFTNWFNREEGAETIDLSDPPGINYATEGATNSRTLEFYIVFSNEEGMAAWLRLRQELSCDGNTVTRQHMEIVDQGEGDNPMYPPNDGFDPTQG